MWYARDNADLEDTRPKREITNKEILAWAKLRKEKQEQFKREQKGRITRM